jgi:hypothetical protein
MSTSYGMSRRTWKWTKKLFFRLTDLIIVNVLIIHRSYMGTSHTKFRKQLTTDLILLAYDHKVTVSGHYPWKTKR